MNISKFEHIIESYENGNIKVCRKLIKTYGMRAFIVDVLDDEYIIQTAAGIDKNDIIKLALRN
jgi:hypothetical protein